MGDNVHYTHIAGQRKCAPHALADVHGVRHDLRMRLRLREIRTKRKLTLEKVAEHLDMSHSQISRIERGESDFTGKTLAALADLYGVEVGDLFARERGGSDDGPAAGAQDENDPSSYAAVGARLKHLRAALGMSAEMFRKMVDIDLDRGAAQELGLARVDVEEALRISQRTTAPPSWLYFGDRSDVPGRLMELLDKAADSSDVG